MMNCMNPMETKKLASDICSFIDNIVGIKNELAIDPTRLYKIVSRPLIFR